MNIVKHSDFVITCDGIEELWVYDIEVENNHNFFANDILVHNSGYFDVSKILYKKHKTKDIPLQEGLDTCGKVIDKILVPFIETALDQIAFALNARHREVLDMEQETIADKFVSVADKRYFCRYYKKETDGTLTAKHKITGLSLINKGTPPFCKDKLKPVLDIILDQDPTVLIEYIDEVRDQFDNQSIDQISIIKGLSNIDYQLKGFKRQNEAGKLLTAPIHSRGGIIHNKVIERDKLNYDKIRAGDKVYYTRLKVPNKEAYNENVISYTNPKFMHDSNMIKNVDFDTMFEKNFLENIKLITEPIGWSLNPLQGLSDEWC